MTEAIDLVSGHDSYFPDSVEDEQTPHVYEVVAVKAPTIGGGLEIVAVRDEERAAAVRDESSEQIDTSSASFEGLLRQYTESAPYRPVSRQLDASKQLYRTLESPLQRLAWLQQELAALQASLGTAAAGDDVDAQARQLQQQLGELVQQHLLHNRQRITVEAGALTAPPASGNNNHESPSSSSSSSSSLAHFARLEQRLARLEARLVGASSPSSQPIVERVRQLEQQLAALTPEAVELLDARARLAVEEQQRNAGDFQILPSKIQEIEDVHRLMAQWDAVRKDLPRVVERLNTLKNVHDSSLSFAQDVRSAEATSAAALAILKSNEQLLQQVQAGFDANVSTILANCEALKARIDALPSHS